MAGYMTRAAKGEQSSQTLSKPFVQIFFSSGNEGLTESHVFLSWFGWIPIFVIRECA